MLRAQLIVWAPTREKAIERMKRALNDTIITGQLLPLFIYVRSLLCVQTSSKTYLFWNSSFWGYCSRSLCMFSGIQTSSCSSTRTWLHQPACIMIILNASIVIAYIWSRCLTGNCGVFNFLVTSANPLSSVVPSDVLWLWTNQSGHSCDFIRHSDNYWLSQAYSRHPGLSSFYLVFFARRSFECHSKRFMSTVLYQK